MLTYYEILGLEPDASAEEIRHAYLEIMKRHHPDHHGQQNDPLSRLANEAYSALKDPHARMRYDSGLTNSRRHSNPAPPAPKPPTEPVRTARPSPSPRPTPVPSQKSQPLPTRSYLVSCRKCRESRMRGDWGCLECFGIREEPEAPTGRVLCPSCRGWRKKAHTEDNPIWKGSADGSPNGKYACKRCNGSGLEPLPVDNFNQRV